MAVFVYGIALFIVAFIMHVAIWRVRRPERLNAALLRLYLGLLLAFLLVSSFLPSAGLPAVAFWDAVCIALMHTSLTLAYIATYTAVEADSPSLIMMRAISEAGPDGLDKDIFYAQMGDDLLVRPRLADMLRDDMAVMRNGKYILTAKGSRSVRLMKAFRELMGLGKGG